MLTAFKRSKLGGTRIPKAVVKVQHSSDDDFDFNWVFKTKDQRFGMTRKVAFHVVQSEKKINQA